MVQDRKVSIILSYKQRENNKLKKTQVNVWDFHRLCIAHRNLSRSDKPVYKPAYHQG